MIDLFNVHVARVVNPLSEKRWEIGAQAALSGEPYVTPVTQAGSPNDCLELDLLTIADLEAVP